jgi:hypothetical protein
MSRPDEPPPAAPPPAASNLAAISGGAPTVGDLLHRLDRITRELAMRGEVDAAIETCARALAAVAEREAGITAATRTHR